MDITRKALLWILVVFFGALYGCGGGGGDGSGGTPPGSGGTPPTEDTDDNPDDDPPTDDDNDSSDDVPEETPDESDEPPFEELDNTRQVIATLEFDAAPDATLYDEHNQRLYLTFEQDRSLEVIDILDGATLASISFDHMPERVAVSHSGDELYVALITQEHSYYRSDDEQGGHVAVVDAQTLEVTRTFATDIDPFDIAVSHDNQLLISSGSGQWTELVAYDAATGTAGARTSIRHRSRLRMHPTENRVFSVDTDTTSQAITRFDINDSDISEHWESGDYGTGDNVWITPDGRYFITQYGDVVRTSTYERFSHITPSNTTIENVHFDQKRHIIQATLSDNKVWTLNLKSLERIGETTVFGSLLGAYIAGPYAYYLTASDNDLSIVREGHPCYSCDTNTAPDAEFSFTPTSGDTADIYQFDASESEDTEDGSDLRYRWDIGANGDWDTAFSDSPTLEHEFKLSGTHAVRLEVIDPQGLTGRRLQIVEVAQGVRPGTDVEPGTSDSLGITATHVIPDLQRGKLYISDANADRLYIVDLTSGEAEKYFEFEDTPSRMALSDDGSQLYLGLGVLEDNGYYYEDDEVEGYVAVINLEDQSHIDTVVVGAPPLALAATTDNRLLVASGGHSNGILSYDLTTGGAGDSANFYYSSRLLLDAQGERLIALGDSRISTFDLASGGLSATGKETYDVRLRTEGWLSPDGAYLITDGGKVVSTTTLSERKSLISNDTWIRSVSFDPEQNLFVALLEDNTLKVINLESFEQISQSSVASSFREAYLYDGRLYYLTGSGSGLETASTEHPCANCGDNTPPLAAFSYTPLDGDTSDTYHFDASDSNDTEDGANLQFRWDIGANGVWDTNFSSSPTYSQRFTLPGNQPIRLQVKDSGALVDEVTHTVSVAQGIDTGTEVTDSTANTLAFSSTHVETDTARGKLYITDKPAKRLYVVDIASGLTERYFEFQFMPERMTLAPDASRLYVALLTQEHSSYYWEEDQEGYIAVFDLEQQARVRTFPVNTDPYDLVVTSGGKLIVASGSGQWTDIVAYDTETGSELGRSGTYQGSRLSLHPDENWVFAANNGLSPSDIEKYDIGGTGITSLGDSPYHGDHRMYGNVWATPDGTHLITRGGDVFLAGDMTFVDGLTPENLAIESLAFDVENNAVDFLGSDGALYRYDLATREQLGTQATISAPRQVMHYQRTYVISGQQGALQLQEVAF